MKHKHFLFYALMTGLAGCQCGGKKNPAQYCNPVIREAAMPDPTVIKADDGYFYVYASEDVRGMVNQRNVPIYRSEDMVNWTFVGTSFTDTTRPTFEPQGGIWAPDINRINGRYVLYYAMSEWGGEQTCGIGTAVADAPQGPFREAKMLFRSNAIGVQNSIDPNYFEDADGKKYLFWGSWHGIWGIELTEDGLALKQGATKRQIAGTAYEAAYLHKRGDYYYLFASIGRCCEGLASTYTTVVGRSKDLWGPYMSRRGEPMLDNHHTIALIANYSFVGPGHNSEIISDKDGNDWILYHAYDRVASDNHTKPVRYLLLDKVVWTDGWPLISDGSPSKESVAPNVIINSE
jgi:arabinan endo-1,5-alpha-L-arabinosidase